MGSAELGTGCWVRVKGKLGAEPLAEQLQPLWTAFRGDAVCGDGWIPDPREGTLCHPQATSRTSGPFAPVFIPCGPKVQGVWYGRWDPDCVGLTVMMESQGSTGSSPQSALLCRPHQPSDWVEEGQSGSRGPCGPGGLVLCFTSSVFMVSNSRPSPYVFLLFFLDL